MSSEQENGPVEQNELKLDAAEAAPPVVICALDGEFADDGAEPPQVRMSGEDDEQVHAGRCCA